MSEGQERAEVGSRARKGRRAATDSMGTSGSTGASTNGDRSLVSGGFTPITSWRSEAIRWAWDGYVPLGEMTLLAGSEKAGKSLTCCELVARLSRGQLPGDLRGEPIRCLYLTAEDRIGHVIKPRLDLAGADLSKIMVQPPDDNVVVTFGRVAAAIQDVAVRFVVLDPLVAYLDGLDDESQDMKVRQALGPIIDVLHRSGAAAVAIKHTNKSSGRQALNRVSGSRGYTAAVRSVIFAVDDPDSADRANPDRLLFTRGNLAAASSGHRYGIEAAQIALDDGEVREHPHLVWKGTSTRTVDEAFSAADASEASDRSDTEVLDDALREYLDAAGGSAPARDVIEWAREAHGWSKDQLHRSRKRIGAPSIKTGGHYGGDPQWWWCRTEDCAEALKNAPSAPRNLQGDAAIFREGADDDEADS